MAAELKKGDRVSWRGGNASGTVERVITSRAKVGGRTVSGSRDDPRYLVKNAETGKTTVLTRASLRKRPTRSASARKQAGRAAAKKPAARRAAAAKPATRKPAARKRPPVPPPPQPAPLAPAAGPLRRPPAWRRSAAAGALIIGAVLVAAIVLLSGDDKDEESGAAPTEATTTATEETTTSADAGEASDAAVAALADDPLALSGIGAIASKRIGDKQERLAPRFERAYASATAGLEEVAQAAAGAEGEELEALAAVTAYLEQELELDATITDSFVANSFAEGDSVGVLDQKTTRTEAALRARLREAAAVESPVEAAEVQAAFAAARRANLAYLKDVAAAIDSRNQAALDQALRDGRAAALRAGRRIEATAAALQEQMESSLSGSD